MKRASVGTDQCRYLDIFGIHLKGRVDGEPERESVMATGMGGRLIHTAEDYQSPQLESEMLEYEVAPAPGRGHDRQKTQQYSRTCHQLPQLVVVETEFWV